MHILNHRSGCSGVRLGCRAGLGFRLGLGIDDGLVGRRGDRFNRSRRGIDRRLLALFVIKRARLGKHPQGTNGIRAKANITGGIAIQLRLGLARLGDSGRPNRLDDILIRDRLGSNLGFSLSLGSNDTNQGFVS